MRRHARILTAVAAATTTAATFGFAAIGASASTEQASRTLPRHVFAPYFETYDTSGGLAALSQQSGAKYLSLAFLQTAQAGSCTAYWDGDTSQPISSASFGSDIAAIQAAGGNVIPSFGGYSADTTGTDIADSCTSVPAIAKVYEKVITTYHVPRIDLDIEANSLTNTAGINRRNEAVAQTRSLGRGARAQDPVLLHHAKHHHRNGLRRRGRHPERDRRWRNDQRGEHDDVRLLHRHRAGDGEGHQDRRDRPGTAQLQSLYPGKTSAQLWHMIGITEMPGIDDFGPDETFTKADAVR